VGQGRADPVGDDKQQQDFLLGEGGPRRAAAREEDPGCVPGDADRQGHGVAHGEEREERVLGDAGGAARRAQNLLVLEGLADEPVPRLDGDRLEIAAPKPPLGSGREVRALGVPDEEHGPVGGQQRRDPVHGEGENLGGLEPRQRDGEDLLADRERIAIDVGGGALGGRDARHGR